jgi:hypothetical protein
MDGLANKNQLGLYVSEKTMATGAPLARIDTPFPEYSMPSTCCAIIAIWATDTGIKTSLRSIPSAVKKP